MPSSTSGFLEIPIEDDDIFYPTQSLIARIESTDPSIGIAPNGSVNVSVEDDEGTFKYCLKNCRSHSNYDYSILYSVDS